MLSQGGKTLMIPSKKMLAGMSILFSFLVGFGAGSSRAQSFTNLRLDGGRVSWSKLTFSADRFAVSVTVQMLA